KDRRRMERILNEEVALHPQDAALRYEAGAILLRLGQEQQAARWLVSALLLEPDHQPSKAALADCLEKLGDPKLAGTYRPLLGGAGGRRAPLDCAAAGMRPPSRVSRRGALPGRRTVAGENIGVGVGLLPLLPGGPLHGRLGIGEGGEGGRRGLEGFMGVNT